MILKRNYQTVVPFDILFESANLYNNFYSTTKQRKMNHSVALHEIAMSNLKEVSMNRSVEADFPFF